MVYLAKGWRKPRASTPGGRNEAHNRKNKGGEKKRLLDMGRRKYFGFDLSDLLDEMELAENKSTISATIHNKMTTQSYDDTLEYVTRLKEAGTIGEKDAGRLKDLFYRYSRWR